MDLAIASIAVSAASLALLALVYREVRRMGNALAAVSKRLSNVERTVDRLEDRVEGLPKRVSRLENLVGKKVGEAKREASTARRAAENAAGGLAKLVTAVIRSSTNVYRLASIAEELRLTLLDRLGEAKLKASELELVQGALSIRPGELGVESARALMSIARRLALSGEELGWDLYLYAALALAVSEALQTR